VTGLDWLFVRRGAVFAALALAGLPFAYPSPQSLLLGLPLVVLGHAGRVASFSWLGGQGRTRDPAPPSGRVVNGPYRLRHPVYVSNAVLASGLVVSAGVGAVGAAALIGLALGAYGLLAWREERQLQGVPPRPAVRASWLLALRWERSSFATTAAALLVLGGLAAMRGGL